MVKILTTRHATSCLVHPPWEYTPPQDWLVILARPMPDLQSNYQTSMSTIIIISWTGIYGIQHHIFLVNLLKRSHNPSKATSKQNPQYISKIPYVIFPSKACLRTLPFQWINERSLGVHTSYEVGFLHLHSLLKGCHKPSECYHWTNATIHNPSECYHWTSATIQFGNPCAIIPPRGCLRSLPFQELIYYWKVISRIWTLTFM
jgi:hypothetical protein